MFRENVIFKLKNGSEVSSLATCPPPPKINLGEKKIKVFADRAYDFIKNDNS